MSEFKMPSLGADMEAGTLVEWLKRPGDAVKRGDIIAVVDTAKGAIEIEVFEDGVLDQTIIEPGTKVPVGTVLAMIRGLGAGAAAGAPAAVARAGVPVPTPAPTAIPTPSAIPHALVPALPAIAPAAVPAPRAEGAAPVEAVRARVSPVARKLAADLGVDLSRVKGTGSQGAITREDVERASAEQKAPQPPAPPAPSAPIDRRAAMRAAIAAAMTRSKREIPHYYLSTSVDMSAALTWLRADNEKRPMPERLLPAVLLIKAVALALRGMPDLNGYWVDGGFRQATGIHIGCAIALRGGGLVAPALHDADALDLTTLMRRLQDLVARARAGSLRSSELTDSTITITNLGEQGVESTFGIIYPPQVALVGFGRIAERPWASAGKIEARPVVTATLSADHRATDGHRGALFLSAIDRLLQTPEKL